MRNVIFGILIVLALSGCSWKSAYIGRKIVGENPAVCTLGYAGHSTKDNFIRILPQTCTYSTEKYDVSYALKESETPGEVEVSGEVLARDRERYESYTEGFFTLFLLEQCDDDWRVIETVSIPMNRGKVTKSKGISFSRSFPINKVPDASTFTFHFKARSF